MKALILIILSIMLCGCEEPVDYGMTPEQQRAYIDMLADNAEAEARRDALEERAMRAIIEMNERQQKEKQ